MTPAAFFTRIELLAAIAFFVWFVYDRWQQTVVDVTRHELFKIRHHVFLMAADGKIPFDSPEYSAIRESFNGLIRFSHKMTFPRLLAFWIASPVQEEERRQTITEVISRVKDGEVRHALEKQWRKAGDFLLLGIWLRSPALLAISVIMTPFLPIFGLVLVMDRHSYRNRYKVVRSQMERSITIEACRQADLVTA